MAGSAHRPSVERLRILTTALPDIEGGGGDELADLLFLENVADRLTVLAFDGSTRLSALEALTMSLDGLTYRLTLKKGLHFHCGEEVTASHVVETIVGALNHPASASQLSRYVARDRGRPGGFAVYTVSRYRFEIRLNRRMQDLLARLSLHEFSLRHDGHCFSGSWKVAARDEAGISLTPHEVRDGRAPAYKEVRWEKISAAPMLDGSDGNDEACVYLYAGTQMKTPPEEMLADEICRILPSGVSTFIDLEAPAAVATEARARIARGVRAAFSKNSMWRRSPLTSLLPKDHALHVPFPQESQGESAEVAPLKLIVQRGDGGRIVTDALWEELCRQSKIHGVELIDASERASRPPEAIIGKLRCLVHTHPADAFSPTSQVLAPSDDLTQSSFLDICQNFVKRPRIVPLLAVPFVMRSNRNVARADSTGLLQFSSVKQSGDRLRKLRMRDHGLKALGAALQMLVHDVKRPFSMVQGVLGLLESAKSPARVQELAARYLPDVRKTIGSVDRLIQDVLEIGSDAEPNREDLSLIDLVDGVLRELFSMSPPPGILLSYRFSHRNLLNVDPAKVSRVLSNIVANAVEAMKGKGTIWFESCESGSASERMMTITVGNSNSFIPQDKIAGLFDRFFTEGKKRGTGLGLAIVKKIVLDHGGDVSCASNEKDGTRFILTLPLSEMADVDSVTLPGSAADFAAQKFAGQRHVSSDFASARVLLVEDDPLYSDVVQELIPLEERRAKSLTFDVATDSRTALEKLSEEHTVALIDVDLGPDSEDGLTLVRKIRAIRPALKICVHSDGSPFMLPRLAVEAGADLFLPKPMSRELLTRLLSGDRKVTPEGGALLRVAVVDDDALMLEAWEADPSFDWVTFASPEALLAAGDADPMFFGALAAVVTDYSFPGEPLDGLMLATAIKARCESLKVVLATDHPVAKRTLPSSVCAALPKDPREAVKALRALLMR